MDTTVKIKVKNWLPKFYEGDHVLAANYRTPDERWEAGVVTMVTGRFYKENGEPSVSHKYTVLLNRKSATNNPVRLHVGKDKIKFAHG